MNNYVRNFHHLLNNLIKKNKKNKKIIYMYISKICTTIRLNNFRINLKH